MHASPAVRAKRDGDLPTSTCHMSQEIAQEIMSDGGDHRTTSRRLRKTAMKEKEDEIKREYSIELQKRKSAKAASAKSLAVATDQLAAEKAAEKSDGPRKQRASVLTTRGQHLYAASVRDESISTPLDTPDASPAGERAARN